MQEEPTSNTVQRLGTLSLCLLLSLVLHAVLAIVLILTANTTQQRPTHKKSGTQRAIVVTRAKKNKQASPKDKQEKETEQKPFAKTDADRPQQQPDTADFEGQRNTRAEGMHNASRHSDAPTPTMEGEEKDETNTLQQERQDGDVEHYGKIEEQPQPPAQPAVDTPPTPPTPPPAPGMADAPTTTQPDTGTATTQPAPDATETQTQPQDTTEGALKLQTPDENPQETQDAAEPPAPPAGTPGGNGTAATPTVIPIRRPVYDPTQADHAQPPGLRTAERRTRSTGQFVIGRMPACNVEATPRGQYEELVYRLIARQWYFACDQHRGDIIPGTVIIAIRITARGQVESMNLVNRRGASVSQQSFTFAAIRRAQFPPMPKAVTKTLIGDRMEIIITFDFN